MTRTLAENFSIMYRGWFEVDQDENLDCYEILQGHWQSSKCGDVEIHYILCNFFSLFITFELLRKRH